MEKRIPFIDNEVYHVYNRCNGYDQIFRNYGNYDYFLKKYREYLDPHWETLAWCLMPTHFHLMIRVKPQLTTAIEKVQPCVKAYADFCNGYVQAFNREHGRKGSLFMRNFKRKAVADESYERTLICYIHNNPVTDGFVRSPQDWHHSSFRELFEMQGQEAANNQIIKTFGTKENFLQAHIAEISPGSIDIKHQTREFYDGPHDSVYNLMKTTILASNESSNELKEAG